MMPCLGTDNDLITTLGVASAHGRCSPPDTVAALLGESPTFLGEPLTWWLSKGVAIRDTACLHTGHLCGRGRACATQLLEWAKRGHLTTPYVLIYREDRLLVPHLAAVITVHQAQRAAITVLVGAGSGGRLDRDTDMLPDGLLVNTAALAELADRPPANGCDPADLHLHELLPFARACGHAVYRQAVALCGRLGDPIEYLQTINAVLTNMPQGWPIAPPAMPGSDGLHLHASTLEMVDPETGLSLAEKLMRKLVDIHPPVRLGRDVLVHPGAVLSHCNVDGGCEVGAGAYVINASLGTGSRVGAHARVAAAILGSGAQVASTRLHPTRLVGPVVIGAGARVLSGRLVRPGEHVPPPPDREIRPGK